MTRAARPANAQRKLLLGGVLGAGIALGLLVFREDIFDQRERPSAPTPPTTSRPSVPALPTPAPTVAASHLPVGEPATALAALTGEGVSVVEPWKLTRGTDDWWAGTARKPWPGSSGDPVPSEVSYSIESTTGTTVQKVTLEAEVYNPARHGAAMKAEFVRLVPLLFFRLGLAMPTELPEAIDGEQPFTENVPYGVVRFERKPGNVSHTLSLSIEVVK
jgi:hypothetical protein